MHINGFDRLVLLACSIALISIGYGALNHTSPIMILCGLLCLISAITLTILALGSLVL